MEAEYFLVCQIPNTKNSVKQQELAEKSQFFQRVLKIGNFGQNANGAPFVKISILAIFLAELR